MSFDTQTSLRLIAESLSMVHRFGANPIRARAVRLSDRTLVVEITVSSDDPISVRGEIAGVMGALSGLGVPSLFPVLGVQSFGVRAFDTSGTEVMWILSSTEAAGFIATGQPIEWLNRSWVQENSPSYRRSQADRLIGQLETALRDVLDLHASDHAGDNYPGIVWPDKISDLRDRAEAEGRNSQDSRVLLDFTFLPDLRDAFARHAEWVDDGCIAPPESVVELLTRLNRVRRKVAHHRPVTDDDLATCRAMTHPILASIGGAHHEFVQDFVADRWDDQVAELFRVATRAVQSPPVPERGSVPEPERRTSAVEALESQLAGIEQALDALTRLVVPPQRALLHERGTRALSVWRDALRDYVVVARRPGLSVEEAAAGLLVYEDALAEVTRLRREIEGLRLGWPPEVVSSSEDADTR